MPPEGGSPEEGHFLKMELLDEAIRVLERSELRPGKNSLLLAVSGGVDSMVMLDLLHRSGHAGAVAHFDHGLRGAEGEKDLELVEAACQERGLPFFPVKLEPPEKPPEKGIQNWGREARYDELYRILEEQGLEGISTAHHADDRLETILMGLLRGSGYRGIIGVPTERGRVIRPLIGISKERIRNYAEERKVPYREDPSNRSSKYLRNRIRQELLPVFKEGFPDQEKALLRSMELLEEAGKVLDETGERGRAELLEKRAEGEYRIPIEKLKNTEAPRFWLFELLRPFGMPPERIGELIDGLERSPGAKWSFEGWELLRDREYLILSPRPEKELPEWKIPAPSDPGDAPLSLSEKKVGPNERISFPEDPFQAILDLERARFPLTLRPVRKGDRLRPFGMKEGSKTVLAYLTDRKIPVHEKARTYLLCDAEEEVLWVIGGTIDDRCRVNASTQRILRISYRT